MPVLETRNVFLDTQVFIRSGFNLHKQSLAQLRELCASGRLSLYITDIVKNECQANLREAISDALVGLKKFQRQGVVLQRVESDVLSPLFVKQSEEEIQTKAWEQFEQFLSACKATEVSCKDVDPISIFNLYFSQLAPFGTGKKKSEFPDAFSLRALAEAVAERKCYVITGDKDAEGIQDENLLLVDDLDKFLDIYNRAEEELAQRLNSALEHFLPQLGQAISDTLEIGGAYSDLEVDAEVTEFSVVSVANLEILIVRVDANSAELSINADIEYKATLTEPDYDTATYDREDGVWFFHNPPHVYSGQETDNERFNATVEFSDTGDSLQIDEVSDVTLEGNGWEFPVRISRDGWPYK